MVSDGYGTPKDTSDCPKPGEHGNRKTATIVTITGGGTFKSVDCPYCSKSYILGRELLIMTKFCTECNKTFDLKYPETNEYLSKIHGREIPFRLQDDDCEQIRAEQIRAKQKREQFVLRYSSKPYPSQRATETRIENERKKAADEDAKKDDGSSKPFNPPPAKPRIPDYPHGDSRRGPRNWPVHYDGRH